MDLVDETTARDGEAIDPPVTDDAVAEREVTHVG
jgi:hypothetical protein